MKTQKINIYYSSLQTVHKIHKWKEINTLTREMLHECVMYINEKKKQKILMYLIEIILSSRNSCGKYQSINVK